MEQNQIIRELILIGFSILSWETLKWIWNGGMKIKNDKKITTPN